MTTDHTSRLSRLKDSLVSTMRVMPRSGRLFMLGLAAALGAGLMMLFGDSLNTLEQRLGELGWVLRADESQEQRLTIVAIDEKSIAELGAWPWSRVDMARLTEALNDSGVQLQIHDIVYSEPAEGDDRLLLALTRSNAAAIAHVPVLQSDQAIRTGLLSHAVSGAACQQIAASSGDYLAPHSGFASVAKGHITPIISSDGAVRKVPALICVDDRPYPAMALTAMMQGLGLDNWSVTLSHSTSIFGPARVLQFDAYPGLEVPLDESGNMLVSYRKAPESYQAVSAIDVINGVIDQELLANTWVLVGATAFGIGDIVPTPFSGVAPGIEIQARILTSLLDDAMPFTPRFADQYLGLLTVVFAVLLFALAGTRGRIAAYGLPAAAVLLPISAFTLHLQMLIVNNLWIGWLYPSLFSMLAASLLLLLEQRRLRSERSRVYNNLTSYLPGDVARKIAYSLPNSSIDARRCDVTLLSADLRNFSAFGEARPPEEAAAVLHFFFTRANEIVQRHGGRIQEFKGDGILAVWDGQNAEPARRAYSAARDMLVEIDNGMLSERPPSGLEPLAVGIGIEQGPALAGSIGPASRRTHTLLGDTVTVTFRIQEMTTDLAQPLLIGECAARQLSDFGLQSQGSFLLSGLRIPHCLFAPQPIASARGKLAENLDLRVIKGGRK